MSSRHVYPGGLDHHQLPSCCSLNIKSAALSIKAKWKRRRGMIVARFEARIAELEQRIAELQGHDG